MEDLIKCPFCGEDDFDLIGLKTHLTSNFCEDFKNVKTIEEDRKERAIK